jgi:hypothetical protein
LKELLRENDELEAINDSLRRRNESLDAAIQETEKMLLNIGYTQEDLEKIKARSKLKVAK